MGTILIGWLSEVGVFAAVEVSPKPAGGIEGDGGCVHGIRPSKPVLHMAKLLVDRQFGQKVPQVVGQIFGRHVPFGGSFCQSPETNPLQFLRYAFIHLPQWTRFVVRHFLNQFRL